MSNNESISAKLRRVTDKGRYHFTYEALCNEFEVAETRNWDDLCNVLSKIADEIDREMDELRNKFRVTHPMQAVGDIAAGKEVYPLLREAIDRYYLPRPLFEDGEPAQFGDRFVNDQGRDSTMSSLNYTKGAHDYVSANGGQRHEVTDRFRRPAQPVLDADGVPIDVGDTVWNVFDHQKRTVIGLRGGKAHIESEPGIEFFEAGHELTHREPDTQERIEEDATMPPRAYYAENIGHDVGLKDDEEVWTAVTAHLLRRQRELDGRDA